MANRTEYFGVRVDRDLHKDLMKKAEEFGLSKTELFRVMAEAFLRRESALEIVEAAFRDVSEKLSTLDRKSELFASAIAYSMLGDEPVPDRKKKLKERFLEIKNIDNEGEQS